MASAQCHKPATTIEPCPPRSQKPTTTVANDICQPKTTQHSSLGQKISDMTSKAFKGHHGRHGNSQNQVQCYSQTEIESHGNTNSKKETHYYGQSQTQHDKKHGVSKTQITLTVVQAQITQTDEIDARRSREQDANKQSLCNKRREENMFTNKQCLYDII
ncbi:hypothetical protein Ahy_A03g012817 [Arachis hypogaea]|uniref:Uncharacterized protein n=1 Tax=Arachis hypogaea TaxID=3818 RepID=A0A445DUF9_ARAHY|nr:hypothetical protein Ahy_A03g012817 [Arachis hypogaea]